MALSSYRRILQERFSRTDTIWEYKVRDLPQPATCNAAGYIKSCSFISSAVEQKLGLSLIKLSSNRAISEHSLDSLIHVSFSDFRLQTESGDAAPFKESAEYIAAVLKSGIRINGTHYHFYGHSQSQLKSRSCFLMSGSKEQVNRLVDSLGDFSKIKTVAKKVKRIGLLFSTAHVVMDIDPVRVRDIGDVEYQDYIFTDGCGFISRNLAQILTRKRPIVFRNRRYHPTVFQIRYRGYKGVVILEPSMDPGIWLELRKSMKKFSGGKDLSFAVVEYSKVSKGRTSEQDY